MARPSQSWLLSTAWKTPVEVRFWVQDDGPIQQMQNWLSDILLLVVFHVRCAQIKGEWKKAVEILKTVLEQVKLV